MRNGLSPWISRKSAISSNTRAMSRLPIGCWFCGCGMMPGGYAITSTPTLLCREIGQAHRHALGAPRARRRREHSRTRRAALAAAAVLAEIPCGDDVPVAPDEYAAACVAISAAAGLVVDVAGVDIVQAVGACDIARA